VRTITYFHQLSTCGGFPLTLCAIQIYLLTYLLKISWKDMITNKIVRERTGKDALESIIRERGLRLFGHAYRTDSNRIARQAMDWIPPDFKKKRGRPRVTWTSTIR